MNAQLEQIGQALHGQQWQSALARDLDVADRTVRRWLAGESAVPPGALNELRQLCLKRSAELATLAGQIDAP
jgi:transposase-like protein